MNDAFETVIGLEVHAQLMTATKLFSSAPTAFGAAPNAHTTAVCLGLPGVLPVLNERAVTLAVRAALGLQCTIHRRSQWARKNYFYPDLPKGYQISQYAHPIATGGHLMVPTESEARAIPLTRIHMEEDAGKSVHDDPTAAGRTYVDLNRAGIPLVEIVTEPALRSSEEAAAFLRTLRQLLRFLGVCDGNMEQGSLRCDANVSVRPRGTSALGTRAEIKNLNSFRFLQQAIDFEAMRQVEILEGGGAVVQETRLWDTAAKVTRSMRSKEDAHDYRYFPDPDLPDLVLDEATLTSIAESLPELPQTRLHRYTAEWGLSPQDAAVLLEEVATATYFESAVHAHPHAKAIANWIINELLREVSAGEVEGGPVSPENLAGLVKLIDDDTISGKIAKEVFTEMVASGAAPLEIVERRGLKQMTDTSAIESAVDAVLAAHPDNVEQYRAGKTKVLGFLVGQVMKQTQGKANPKQVNAILRKKLE